MLDKALANQRAELERCLAASNEARAQREECIAEHVRALAERSRLLDQAFTSAHVKAADTEIDTQLSRKNEADKAVKRCESIDQRQHQQLQIAQTAWRRNQERLASFEIRLTAALQSRQAQEDEAADEEAEEMAAAQIGRRLSSSKPEATDV
jgi:hypothetical protein